MNLTTPMLEKLTALPGFMVLGPSGPTMTWLRKQLISHPGIALPLIGETRYFDHTHLPERRQAISREYGERLQALSRRWQRSYRVWEKGRIIRHLDALKALTPHTEKWYRECFKIPASAGAMKGEISPAYTSLPEEGVAAILALMPDIRIVMIVRNPLEDVLDSIRRGFNDSTSGPLSKMEWQQLGDKIDSYQNTRWSEIIPVWERIFQSRIIYLPFDLMHRDPQEFLKQLHGRLDTGLRPGSVKSRLELPVAATPIPAPILKLATERTLADVEFFKKRFADL